MKHPSESSSGSRVRQLAVDIASGLESDETLCSKYGITMDELRAVKENPQFARLIDACREELFGNGDAIDERIAMQAKLGVEKCLPHLMALISDPGAAAMARVSGMAELTRIAGIIDNRKARLQRSMGTGMGERVVINISVPGVSEPVTIEGETREVVDDESH